MGDYHCNNDEIFHFYLHSYWLGCVCLQQYKHVFTAQSFLKINYFGN
jgi:hypothetical protein